MIQTIQLLRSVGTFDDVSTGAILPFNKFALIYAENGRGKTTLSAVLRSLGSGDPIPVLERRRLGASRSPHIVVTANPGSTAVFENDSWSSSIPELFVFDDDFVAQNVHSGMEVAAEHRQNLHDLIIGREGVALNDKLETYVAQVESHNKTLQIKAAEIPRTIRGPLDVDAFCALENREDIDSALRDAERNLFAARDVGAVLKQNPFKRLNLPTIDLSKIEWLLGRTLSDLQAEAANRVQAHLSRLPAGGEKWVAEGMALIEPASVGHDHKICPFCAQDLERSPLIAHYQAYFSDAYTSLRNDIDELIAELTTLHTGEAVASFERSVSTLGRQQQFWGTFTDVPEVGLDTADIALAWKTAYEAVTAPLLRKQSSPLERIVLGNEAKSAVADYEQVRSLALDLNVNLEAANERISLVKEKAAAADLPALQSDLDALNRVKARHSPEIAVLCEKYLKERETKKATEELRDTARRELDEYRTSVFPAYQTAINNYLQRLNAGFRLESVTSVNIRSGSTCMYNVLVNDTPVPLSAEKGEASFRNTLSAGDRNALALGFFFASLERDPERSARIVVIDDPMTSLDEHRTLTTVQEMRRLVDEVQQTIVLSHSKPFLCSLWEGADSTVRSAMRIVRANVGSTLADWDIRQDCITEHDRRHRLVSDYIRNSVNADERAVAGALRPILERFIRVAYPQWFPPGTLLGPFLNLSRQREGARDQILSPADNTELRALLDYANLFHHDTNPNFQTVIINDQELLGFSKRTLRFSSRP